MTRLSFGPSAGRFIHQTTNRAAIGVAPMAYPQSRISPKATEKTQELLGEASYRHNAPLTLRLLRTFFPSSIMGNVSSSTDMHKSCAIVETQTKTFAHSNWSYKYLQNSNVTFSYHIIESLKEQRSLDCLFAASDTDYGAREADYRNIFRTAAIALKSGAASDAKPDDHLWHIVLAQPTIIIRAYDVFGRFNRLKEIMNRRVSETPTSPIVMQAICPEADKLATLGVDARGKVLVSLPERHPYLRPEGVAVINGMIQKPGIAPAPYVPTLNLNDDRVWANGRIFRTLNNVIFEGGIEEQVDYVSTASDFIQECIATNWPLRRPYSEKGTNPFCPDTAPDEAVIRPDITDLAGWWTPAALLRLVVIGNCSQLPGNIPFRSCDLKDARLHVGQRPAYGAGDTIEASFHSIASHLGPNVLGLPEVQSLSKDVANTRRTIPATKPLAK